MDEVLRNMTVIYETYTIHKEWVYYFKTLDRYILLEKRFSVQYLCVNDGEG